MTRENNVRQETLVIGTAGRHSTVPMTGTTGSGGQSGAYPWQGARHAAPCRPLRRTNGYDGSMMGDGRDRDRGRAQQTEAPYWAAPRGSSGGSEGGARRRAERGTGEGTAGYPRELLKDALVYARRAFPSFRASRVGRGPLRRTASFRRPPTKREYACGGPDGRRRTWRSPRDGAPASSSSTWMPKKGRIRQPCSNFPAASLRSRRAPRWVGEGCTSTPAALPDKSYGRRACTHGAGKEQPGAPRGPLGRARRGRLRRRASQHHDTPV